MGPVFSTLSPTVYLENMTLDLNDAICRVLWQMCTTDYYLPFLNLGLSYRQEGHDFDSSNNWKHSKIDGTPANCNGNHRLSRRQIRPFVKANTDGTNVWRSQRVIQKKLYQAVMKEVIVKAEYFRRKFYLFGPPEWRDPATIVLSGITPSHGVSVYPSVFPFVAPHIMISPPSEEEEQNNSLNYQNHDHGNRLIVCLASPWDCFSVLNADESRYPFNLMMMSLRETIVGKAQAPPGCLSISPSVSKKAHRPEAPCLESDDGYSHIPEHEHTQIEIDEKQVDAANNVKQTLKDNFWLEEDDTELPDLPEDW